MDPNISSENRNSDQTGLNSISQLQNRRNKYDMNEENYLLNSYWVWDVDRYRDFKDCYELKHKIDSPDIDFWEWEEEKGDSYDQLNDHQNLEEKGEADESKNNQVVKLNKDDGDFLSQTVEEVLKSKDLSNALKSGPNYGVSRRRLYHLRQDVIIKIIFRQMRKYYLRDFKAFFDFSKCNNKSNSDTKGVLITQINRYLNMKFKNFFLENMDIYFLSIMNISDKYISISEQNKILKQNISELLYWFNKSKLVNTLKIPQFAMIFLRFLSKHDILRQVIKSKTDVEAIQAYSEEIHMLKWKLRSQLKI